jgi:hypothetical protein
MDVLCRTVARPLLAVVAVCPLVACWAGPAQARQKPGNGIYPPTPPAGTASVTVGCAYAIGSPAATPARQQAGGRALVAGPISWPDIRWVATASPARYAPRHGLAPGEKAFVVVNAGATVKVTIPANERARLSLNYTYIPARGQGPAGVGTPLYRLADGASSVTFTACAPSRSGVARTTAFAGFLIVDGAQCARLDIYTSAARRPLRRQIPFGVSPQSCPASPTA